MFEPIPIPDNTVLVVLSMRSGLDIEYLRHTQLGFLVSPGGYRQRGPLVTMTGIWEYHSRESLLLFGGSRSRY